MRNLLTKSLPEPEPPRLDVAAFDPATRRRLSGPGLRTFLAIADLWGLGEEQRRRILGLPSRSTYHNWARAAREHRPITLDLDVLTRISAVLGIHQALGILHASEAEGLAWLRGPHQATVWRFLDAARGGLYMGPVGIDRDFTPYTDADIVLS